MNEGVRRVKSRIAKVTCMAIFLTMFTGYGTALAEDGLDLNQKREELEEKNKEAYKSLEELGDNLLNKLVERNESLNDEENARVTSHRNPMKISVEKIMIKDNVNGKLIERPVIRCYLFDGTDGSNLQIWAMKDGEHLLIKDYDVEMGHTTFGRIFEWHLERSSSMAKENIFRRNEEEVLRNYYKDNGEIGIYIKQKRGNKVFSYYKKVAHDERKYMQPYLITSYDTNIKINKMIETWNGNYDKLNVGNPDMLLRPNSEFEKLNKVYGTQFPAIAVKDKPFQITMIMEERYCGDNSKINYTLSVIGDAYEVPLKLNNEYKKYINYKNYYQDLYEWEPEFDGVFKIVAKKIGTEEVLAERKVFVRKLDNEGDTYLGINNMTVEGSGDNVKVKVDVKNFNDANNKGQVSLRVGEESVWSMPLKNYGLDDGQYLIGESFQFDSETTTSGNIKFKMGTGTYLFDASVKKEKSIEFEDRAHREYNKNSNHENLFKVSKEEEEDFDESKVPVEFKKMRFDREYGDMVPSGKSLVSELIERVEKKVDFYIAPIDKTTQINNYEYAFLLWDARGKRVIQKYEAEKKIVNRYNEESGKYEESVKFTYYFRDPGDYKVYLRVREKNNESKTYNGLLDNGYLKNAYLEQFTENIDIDYLGDEIEIEGVEILSYKLLPNADKMFKDTPKSREKTDDGKILIKAHTKNIISIKANCEKVRKGRLMYKVYAIHDGYWELVTPYTASAVIPFYPRSTGEYKILVLVKDSISGSEEAKRYIDVIAED